MLSKKEKRYKHRSIYIESNLDDFFFNVAEEDKILFSNKHTDKEQEEENEEIIVPIRLTIGVTVALVGLFIYFVPLMPPNIKGYGTQLIGYGITMAAEACYTCYDENQKEKKSKK